MGAAIAAAIDDALGAPGFVTGLPVSPAEVLARIVAQRRSAAQEPALPQRS